VNFTFGIIAVVTGLGGVTIGGLWAQWWRRYNARADPLVCGLSALMAVPFVFLTLVVTDLSINAGFVRSP